MGTINLMKQFEDSPFENSLNNKKHNIAIHQKDQLQLISRCQTSSKDIVNKKKIGFNYFDIRHVENKERIFDLLVDLKFEEMEEIGSGTYGIVIRARTSEGYIRAIKVQFLTQYHNNIEFKIGKFLSSEGTENLSHNNIIVYQTMIIKDEISNRSVSIMEMELADKSLKNEIYENLDQEQRTLKTPLTDEKYKQICTQLLQNMLSMHNNNIVHRDIKLDNILVINRYSDYVLADFGVAEEITNLHEN